MPPDNDCPGSTRFRHALEQSLGVPFNDGNSLAILQNGDEIFPAMLHAIETAVSTIDFATYVYWEGDIAERMARALSQRAKEGVQVRVLLDAFGAKRMSSSLVDMLKASRVAVRWFRPLSTWRLWRSDKRMHRKLLICDQSVAFTGGVGIAEEWEGDARNPGEWRDTHVALRGPALTGLKAAFLDNWNEAGEWTLEDEVQAPQRAGEVSVQVVRGSTTIGWTDTAGLLRTLIALSEQQLRIVTAYFNPDDALVDLVLDAHQRGVDVRILIPGRHTDSRLSQLAGADKVQRLLEVGIGIFQYQRTMLHAKLMTVDSAVACIGSANFNMRSLAKDEECCVVALCEKLTGELNARFDTDCVDSHLLDAKKWAERGRLRRLAEWSARLIAEQL